MRATFEIRSGYASFTRFWLRPGQTVRVGRTRHADYTIADEYLSGLHCELSCTDRDCLIRDLGSRNGTKVNEKAVTEAKLTNGDVVEVGNTILTVEIESSEPPQTQVETPPVDEKVQAGDAFEDTAFKGQVPIPASPIATNPPLNQYSTEQVQTGVKRFRFPTFGNSTDELIRGILLLISRFAVPYIVVSFDLRNRIDSSQFSSGNLCDWIPNDVADRLSPMVLWGDHVELAELFVREFTSGEVSCFFSTAPKYLPMLSVAARGQISSDQAPRDSCLFNQCLSTELTELLAVGNPRFAESVFSHTVATVTRAEDESIVVLGSNRLATELDKAGWHSAK